MILDIEVGSVILTHNYGFKPLPWAIRKVTGSYWNHAVTVIEINNIKYILESDIHGVRITKTLEFWLEEVDWGVRDYCIVEGIKCDFNKLQYVIGNKYDLKALLIDQVIYQIGKKLFNKSWYFGHSASFASKSLYCFELILFLAGVEHYYKYTGADIEKEFNLILRK